MGFDEEAVTDEQREACAVVVMRTMLEDWCDDTGSPFDDALDAFASSRTYELLFDFSSRQWAEGPRQPPLRVGAGEERLADRHASCKRSSSASINFTAASHRYRGMFSTPPSEERFRSEKRTRMGVASAYLPK